MFGWLVKRGRVTSDNLPAQKTTTSNWGLSSAPHQGSTDADGISRFFSKELFEGEVGAALHSIGFSPDMAGNIAQTEDTFATINMRSRDKLARFVDGVDRQLPSGMRVKPHFLVPESIWLGEYRNFLCATCGLYPADPKNVFFLAGTLPTAERTALQLQSNLTFAEAHDGAQQCVRLVAEAFEKALASGRAKHEATATARNQAEILGTMMMVKSFENHQYSREVELFGKVHLRTFDKVPGVRF